MYKLGRGIDKQDAVVLLTLLQNDDAGGYGGAKEKVRGQLNDRVDVVVVDQILADLLLGPSSVQHPGKLDNGGRSGGGQPGEHMHGKGQIRFALWGQHSCRGKAGIIYKQRVVIAFPFDGIGWIGDYGIKGLIVPVLRFGKGIAVGDIKLLIVDIV